MKERVMFAREWKCKVPREKCDAFIDYLHLTGVKESSSTPGCIGAQIFRRDIGGKIEITLLTYWDKLSSIEAFAGADIDRAKLYPEDQKYELEPELTVQHYEVLGHSFTFKGNG